jgi:NAD(P)-dependent dehydrogenase (short-subunit alcohol dehydrogenase family)
MNAPNASDQVPPRPRFDGQCFVVTGGGSGIGRATVLRLASEGAAVVVVGRREAALRAVVAEVEAASRSTRGRALAVAGDVAQEPTAQRACAAASERFGRLDGFVHAAGQAIRGAALETTTREQLDAMFDVHLRALVWLVKHAAPPMRARGGGAIVTVTSNLARVAIPGLAAYVAAKGAVEAATRSLAVELGPDRIRVNAVCPGLVETPTTNAIDGAAANFARYAQRAPLRRVGKDVEVAAAAAFLLSSDSAWTTGQTLVVDGGYAIA